MHSVDEVLSDLGTGPVQHCKSPTLDRCMVVPDLLRDCWTSCARVYIPARSRRRAGEQAVRERSTQRKIGDHNVQFEHLPEEDELKSFGQGWKDCVLSKSRITRQHTLSRFSALLPCRLFFRAWAAPLASLHGDHLRVPPFVFPRRFKCGRTHVCMVRLFATRYPRRSFPSRS